MIFDIHWKRYDAWYDRNRDLFKKELDFIRKNIESFNLGLEVGVGSGRFANELGIEYGIDISIQMLKLAKERGIEVVRGDASHLPFKRVFDAVFFIFTICFLKDPLQALISARNVLVEGGKILICAIPKESKLSEEYSKKKNLFYNFAKFYTSNEIVKMLKEAGFSVVKTDFENLKYGKDIFIALGINEKV